MIPFLFLYFIICRILGGHESDIDTVVEEVRKTRLTKAGRRRADRVERYQARPTIKLYFEEVSTSVVYL